MIRSVSRRLDALGGPGILAALAIAVAPLAMGGVHAPTRAVTGCLAVLALVWMAARVRGAGTRLELGLPGVALLILLGWTLLQWVPLPAGLVALVAPATAEAVLATAAALGGPGPGWYAISLDPPRTAAAALTWMAVLGVYLVVLNATHGSTQRRLVRWTTAVAALVLLIGIAQTALGAERIYGLYQPSIDLDDVQLIKTTFVNPNHAAALFLVCACLSFGLWLDARPHDRHRNWHLGVFGLLCLGIIGSLSRANTVLLAGALLAMLALVQWRHPGKATARRAVRVVAALVCVAATAILLVDPHRWWVELSTLLDPATLLEKEGPIACWRVGWQVVDAQPLVGVGHGAFSTIASARMVDWDLGFADYAHNGAIQAIADWGWPVALLSGSIFVLGLVGWLRRSLGHLDLLGLGVGLVAILLQNMVDFSLLVPGVAVPAAAAAGWLAAGTVAAPEDPRGGARSVRLPWGPLASLGLLAVTALLAWDAVAQDPARWERDLRLALAEGKPARHSIETMLGRHPSDFRLFRLAAIAASRADRVEQGLRLADRAVDLAGREPETRRVRALLRLDRGDVAGGAEDLVRLANLGGPHTAKAADLVWRHGHLEGLAEATFRAHPAFALAAGRRLVVRNESAAAERLFAWAVDAFPDALEFREELAALLSQRPSEAARVSALATRTLAQGGQDADPARARAYQRTGYLLEGLHLRSRGRHGEAYHMFLEAAWLDEARALRPLLEAGEALLARRDPAKLATLLPDLEAAVVGEAPSWRAAFHRLASHESEARGDVREALTHARSAIRFLPGNPRHHYRLANLLERQGDAHAAERARQRAALLSRGAKPALIDWMTPERVVGEEEPAPRR